MALTLGDHGGPLPAATPQAAASVVVGGGDVIVQVDAAIGVDAAAAASQPAAAIAGESRMPSTGCGAFRAGCGAFRAVGALPGSGAGERGSS